MQDKIHLPRRIDRLASKWWFYLILTALFFLPAYTTFPYNAQDATKVVIEVLSRSFVYSVPYIFPLFKLVTLAAIVLVLVRPKQFTKVFYAWAALDLFIIAIIEDMANTPTYGFTLLTGNLAVFMVISLFMGWTAMGSKEPLGFERLSWWRYWVVPAAALLSGSL